MTSGLYQQKYKYEVVPITILWAVRRCQTIVASPNDKFFLHNECQDQDDILQSTKILLPLPKYEIIMVPSNHSNFQYFGLFSIAPCKVITLNPLCILFCFSSLLLFWWLSLSKVIALPTIFQLYGEQYRKEAMNRSTKLYKNKAKRFRAKVGRAIIKWGGIEKSPILR